MAAKAELSGSVRAALDAAVDEADAQQLDMMLPGLRSALTADEKSHIVETVKRDKAGRPAGSRNLATRDMLDFVRRLFGDPVHRRAQWLQHTPETLAKVLGCTKLEAFDRLDRIASELSRLFYAPLAPVDAKGNAVPPVLLFSVTAAGGQVNGRPIADRPPWEYDGGPFVAANEETQQNQRVIEHDGAPSHEAPSHAEE